MLGRRPVCARRSRRRKSSRPRAPPGARTLSALAHAPDDGNETSARSRGRGKREAGARRAGMTEITRRPAASATAIAIVSQPTTVRAHAIVLRERATRAHVEPEVVVLPGRLGGMRAQAYRTRIRVQVRPVAPPAPRSPSPADRPSARLGGHGRRLGDVEGAVRPAGRAAILGRPRPRGTGCPITITGRARARFLARDPLGVLVADPQLVREQVEARRIVQSSGRARPRSAHPPPRRLHAPASRSRADETLDPARTDSYAPSLAQLAAQLARRRDRTRAGPVEPVADRVAQGGGRQPGRDELRAARRRARRTRSFRARSCCRVDPCRKAGDDVLDVRPWRGPPCTSGWKTTSRSRPCARHVGARALVVAPEPRVGGGVVEGPGRAARGRAAGGTAGPRSPP